jgi:hypothetical protein
MYPQDHILGESPQKCPFEVKTRSKKVSPGEAPDEKAGIARDQRILRPWLLP